MQRCCVILCQGICDGAAALVLASEAAVKANNLTPLARIVSYGISGQCVHESVYLMTWTVLTPVFHCLSVLLYVCVCVCVPNLECVRTVGRNGGISLKHSRE